MRRGYENKVQRFCAAHPESKSTVLHAEVKEVTYCKSFLARGQFVFE